MNPLDRFQVCDPRLGELVEAYSQRATAMRVARREAERRSHAMEVFDAMSHRGAVVLWRIYPTGEIATQTRLMPSDGNTRAASEVGR